MSVDTVARQANEAIVDAFSNVDVIADGYESVRGIFTGPSEAVKLDGGGFVDAKRGTLIVKSAEAGHLDRRTTIILQFESGKKQSFMVVLPENDGSGRLKLTLGQENVEHQSSNQSYESVISY